MANSFARMVQTIDSHTEGNSTRVIVGGVPVPPGNTLLERREALWRHDDGLRRMLNFEPRGHGMMCSVLLMPPIGDARLLDHHHGAGRIRADVWPLPDRRRHHHRRHRHEGRRRAGDAVADRDAGRAGRGGGGGGQAGAWVRSSFVNVESFVLYDRVPVEVPDFGRLTVSIAYGGDFYCFVDADAIGVELGPTLRAADAGRGAEGHPRRQRAAQHPPPQATRHQSLLSDAPHLGRDHGGRLSAGDHVPARVSRSLAMRHRHECQGGPAPYARRVGDWARNGDLKARWVPFFQVRWRPRSRQGGILYVRPRVSGRAYLTGFHQFVLEQDDPLPRGFRVGPKPRDVPAPTA